MPWRNSHWRVQNFVGQPSTTKNGSGPDSAFPGRFDENSAGVPITMQPVQPNPIDPDHIIDAPDAQSTECPGTMDALTLQDDLSIEGGTINISSVYSEGLLAALTQALESTGVDLSQASISVQINLGNILNMRLTRFVRIGRPL